VPLPEFRNNVITQFLNTFNSFTLELAMDYKIADISLADKGKLKIEWAESRMPVLMALRERYSKTKPLTGTHISCCLHVTKETAVLIKTLCSAGAEVSLCGSNPLSTQDDAAAAMVSEGAKVFAWRGNHEEYYWCVEQVLGFKPNITIDDGGDLVFTVHNKHPELFENIIGGCEETTTGIIRLKAMAAQNRLKYPIISVSEARTKSEFDSTWGVGQSTIDGILRATSILLAGQQVVVCGYGYVGVGIAKRAKGMGSRVTVCEVNPINALYASMEGFNVDKIENAAKYGDVFITATGCKHVITAEHMKTMKSGAILANSGHFTVEVATEQLEKLATAKRKINEHNVEYTLPDGKKLHLLAEGRLVNLVAADGSAPSVMDLSFANQFMAALRLKKEGASLQPAVHNISKEQDEEIARLKLATTGIEIDTLTKEQKTYLESCDEGT